MITESGQMRPCCKLDASKINSWQTVSISDGIDAYHGNPGLKDLKDWFIQGIKPDACHRCWTAESHGMVSHRELLDDNIGPGLGRFDLTLGNLCNLKCRICNPEESSRYIKEWSDLFGESAQLVDMISDQSQMDTMAALAMQADLINISGGEPLLITKHFSILEQLIDGGRAPFTSLQYHTNGTVPINMHMLDVWSRFKNVEITFSIDGTGKRFEYNRHPAAWTDVENNIRDLIIRKTGNVSASINTTLSVFTVDGLVELFDWANGMGLPPPHLHILRSPSVFQASVLPLALRQRLKLDLLRQKHLRAKTAIGILDEDATHLLPALRQRITIQDKYRNESFADVFPDLASHIFG